MKKIELSGKVGKGKFVIVDNENFNYLNQFRWHCDNGYAHRKEYIKDDGKFDKSKYRNIYMQSLVIECPKDKMIEHANRNGLDNRKSNLRIANWAQNMQNRKTKKSITGIKGVFFSKDHKRRKRWIASIAVSSKRIHLGRFLTPEEAALAYNQAAKQYFGEFAYLNQIEREVA